MKLKLSVSLVQGDIDELAMDSSDDLDDSQSDIDSDVDMIGAERRSRDHARHRLRQRAGEPPKPAIAELCKLMPDFVVMLRRVLAD